jgi:hypothetical protein
MKAIVLAMTALTLATGAASAATGANERPEFTTAEKAPETVQVPAGSVMTTRELVQAGLSADDLVTITRINTTEQTASIDNSSRGFY